MKLNFIAVILVVVLMAVIGEQLTFPSIESGWYESLVKPTWTPDEGYFAPIWIVIYILTTISFLIFYNSPNNAGNFLSTFRLFILSAALNVFWSYLFFNRHLIFAAFLDSVAMAAIMVFLTVRLWEISHTASILLLPYFFWVSFALYLNLIIWILNR